MEHVDELLDEARDGGPSAHELRSMHDALGRRLDAMQREVAELPRDAPGRERFDRQITTIKRQMQALAEETSITEFVEESALVTLQMQQLEGC